MQCSSNSIRQFALSNLHFETMYAVAFSCDDTDALSSYRGINLGKKRHPSLADLSFSGMVSLRSLSITHCSVSTLDHIDGR